MKILLRFSIVDFTHMVVQVIILALIFNSPLVKYLILLLSTTLLHFSVNAQYKVDSSLSISARSVVRPIALIIPFTFMSSGLIFNNNYEEGLKMEIAEERNEYIPHFHTKVDNYLQFAPIALCYGLDALGYKGKNPVKQQTILLIESEIIMTGLVSGLKYTTKQMRPDNSKANSFPSGHTAQAFAAASFLSLEYQSKFHWIPYVSYGIASSVGLLRMANNRHYVSDVLMGAGIGILSTRLVYWNQERAKNKHRVHSAILM